jgi:hypothetical protein
VLTLLDNNQDGKRRRRCDQDTNKDHKFDRHHALPGSTNQYFGTC